MRHVYFVVGLIAVLSVPRLFAQESSERDPCHAERSKAKNFFAFDQFDKELRTALARQDPVALAFLVNFPLRVNDAGGTISIDDAAALNTHFQKVFTPAVRSEILGTRGDKFICNVEGVGYASGVIWVNASDHGYAIWSVNRDAVPPYPYNRPDKPRLDYVGQTDTHRIAVDTLADGNLRYRSWKKPRAVTEAPDLVISKGVDSVQGTDYCAVRIYTFKNGNAVYEVAGGVGCDQAPDDVTGRLAVTVAGKETDWWCY